MYERSVVCAKKIDLAGVSGIKSEWVKEDFQREVAVMGGLRSNSIVRILGCIIRREELVIVMEYLSNGSLRELLDGKLSESKLLPFNDQVTILLDIAMGMKYLHSHGVLHRDLKTLNVLINETGQCKVADFGQSKSSSLSTGSSMATNSGQAMGTKPWNAPEVLKGEQATKTADAYAFGIIMWEVLTTLCPFDGMSAAQIITKVVVQGGRPEVPGDIEFSEDLETLFKECWAEAAEDRPAFRDVTRRLENLWSPDDRKRHFSGVGGILGHFNDTANDESPGVDLEEYWSKLKEEAGVEEDKMGLDSFVSEVEGIFFDYDDIDESLKDTFILLANSKTKDKFIIKDEWEEFCSCWRKSEKPPQAIFMDHAQGWNKPPPAQADVELHARELKGTYKLYCFPCGAARWRVVPSGRDYYNESGLFCLFLVIPIPLWGRRYRNLRQGKNAFTLNNNKNDNHVNWKKAGAIHNSILCCLWIEKTGEQLSKSERESKEGFPEGWEAKVDTKSDRTYYIDSIEKNAMGPTEVKGMRRKY